MICMWQIRKNGEVIHFDTFKKPMSEVAKSLPEGVYTTLRTYDGDLVLRLGEHCQRLIESANLLGYDLNLDLPFLRQILRVAIYDHHILTNKRLRIHIDTTQHGGDIFLLSEKLTTPTEQELVDGAKAITRHLHRETARAKSSVFISIADEVRKGIQGNVNEVLMVGDEGEILEGLSSNFFAVINHQIWTAEEGVLFGITRGLVIDACAQSGYQVVKKSVRYENKGHIEEAFITSASRGVLPITWLDGEMIGSGTPGYVTTEISRSYTELLSKELEKV